MTSRKKPKYIEVDGFRLVDAFLPEMFQSASKFKPGPDEVFVATYPKCGTTWMCTIVLLILRRGQRLARAEEYFAACPFLEHVGAESTSNMQRPGCIKTHLPFDMLNFSKQAKYIYVARHPADCAVSFYHHTRFFPVYRFSDGTFDDFFELFVSGQTDFNDYFDNLLSWYEHRDEPNILFLTFEYMKAHHRDAVLKVAEFLGEAHLSALTENNGELLNKIVLLSSFDYMKKESTDIFKHNIVEEPALVSDPVQRKMAESWKTAMEEGHVSIGDFIRKGTAGEGKTALSDEQREKLKNRIMLKTRGSDVMSLWQKY